MDLGSRESTWLLLVLLKHFSRALQTSRVHPSLDRLTLSMDHSLWHSQLGNGELMFLQNGKKDQISKIPPVSVC